MRAAGFGFILAAAILGTACRHTPSAPSSTLSAISQAAVTSAMAQSLSQVAVLAPTSGDVANSITFPCAGGGSIVTTFGGSLPRDPGTVLTTSSRSEFRDCKSGNTTINGDPYLESHNQHVFSDPSHGGAVTSTMSTSGGLRFDTNGVQGRVQFNCT